MLSPKFGLDHVESHFLNTFFFSLSCKSFAGSNSVTELFSKIIERSRAKNGAGMGLGTDESHGHGASGGQGGGCSSGTALWPRSPPTILSGDPWILHFENFISPTEAGTTTRASVSKSQPLLCLK